MARIFESLMIGLILASLASCAEQSGDPGRRTATTVDQVVIESSPGVPRPPFEFAREDEQLLEAVQHGAFNFFWNAVSPVTGMVYDRTSPSPVSVAGVGFQLSALPVGVERGWVTREAARDRALLILRSLEEEPSNRKAGLFFHYLDPDTAACSQSGYETVVSTIDSALLFAGILTASSYFGGEVAEIGDRLFREADWQFFVQQDLERSNEMGFISLGWKPADPADPTGEGALLPYSWIDSGDEHRLVTFLAVAAPEQSHRVEPERYYMLRRRLGTDPGAGLMVWFPWSGALFTAFFSHCWIDYAHMGPDSPGSLGVERRSRVDWWENSRRTALMHHRKAVANPAGIEGFSSEAWGLSASDAPDGYRVPGLFPDPVPMPGAFAEVDYPQVDPDDDYGDGTIAPYSAGSSVMFLPEQAVASLRYFRELQDEDGRPLLWRDPATGGFGFLDAVNLGKNWVASDHVAIDQGPLILAIENARTGLIWRLFHDHPTIKGAMNRLALTRQNRVSD